MSNQQIKNKLQILGYKVTEYKDKINLWCIDMGFTTYNFKNYNQIRIKLNIK